MGIPRVVDIQAYVPWGPNSLSTCNVSAICLGRVRYLPWKGRMRTHQKEVAATPTSSVKSMLEGQVACAGTPAARGRAEVMKEQVWKYTDCRAWIEAGTSITPGPRYVRSSQTGVEKL